MSYFASTKCSGIRGEYPVFRFLFFENNLKLNVVLEISAEKDRLIWVLSKFTLENLQSE